jgi:hypothetical protein
LAKNRKFVNNIKQVEDMPVSEIQLKKIKSEVKKLSRRLEDDRWYAF